MGIKEPYDKCSARCQYLWATNTDVRPEASSVRLSMMPRSVAVSSAEVASSQIKSFGDLQIHEQYIRPVKHINRWASVACHSTYVMKHDGLPYVAA